MTLPGLFAFSAWVLLILASGGAASRAEPDQHGRYLSQDKFLAEAFGDEQPEVRTVWIVEKLRAPIEKILGHPFGSLRVRYWINGNTSAWILDEIGKDLPITIGVVVKDGEIDQVRILEFRESRGWEVRYPFFTEQFRDASLTEDGRLDQHIDGITGATLSVRAVTRVARVALYLDEQIANKSK